MSATVKLTSIGNSTGIVIPREMLAKLRVKKGDNLYLTETPDGLHLAPYEPDFARKMDLLEEVMQENRDVLRKLAK